MAERKSLRDINAGGDADSTREGSEDGEDDEDTEGTSNDEAKLYPFPVYMWDDLTSSMAKLAYKARELRRNHRIQETWVFDYQIMIKDNANKIHKVNKAKYLNKYMRPILLGINSFLISVAWRSGDVAPVC